MISLIGGALLRFLPDIGSWVGNFFMGREDDRREAKAAKLQIELERLRGQNQMAVQGMQNEHTEALNLILAQQDELRQTIADRQSARAYGSTLHKTITETLRLGGELHIWPWAMSLGWSAAVAVEVFSAMVQPMIAATVFTMWAAWKAATFYGAFQATGLTAALAGSFLEADWMLMESVVGFYLAGRVKARIGANK